MDRALVQKYFENMGGRITIRRGTSLIGNIMRLNIAHDKKGEHFTLTLHPDLDEATVDIHVLDTNPKLRQMLLMVKYPAFDVDVRTRKITIRNDRPKIMEKFLVGHDELHWFVTGASMAKTIREAFQLLRPEAVQMAMHKAGAKPGKWYKRKQKGAPRQGEWFFTPVHFELGP